MLTEVTIEGFKSIAELEVPLGRINLVAGYHGHGKTSLLEGVGMLAAAANGRVDAGAMVSRGLRPGSYQACNWPLEERDAAAFTARNDKARYRVLLGDGGDGAWRHDEEVLFHGRRPVVRFPGDASGAREPVLQAAGRLSSRNPARRLVERLGSYAIYASDPATMRGLRADSRPHGPLGLAGGGLAEAVEGLAPEVKEAVAKVLEWPSAIETREVEGPGDAPRRVVVFRNRYTGREITADEAGDGALQALFAAVLATSPSSPAFFAIDDLDRGLDLFTAGDLVEAFCRWFLETPGDRQVLATIRDIGPFDAAASHEDVWLYLLTREDDGRIGLRLMD